MGVPPPNSLGLYSRGEASLAFQWGRRIQCDGVRRLFQRNSQLAGAQEAQQLVQGELEALSVQEAAPLSARVHSLSTTFPHGHLESSSFPTDPRFMHS